MTWGWDLISSVSRSVLSGGIEIYPETQDISRASRAGGERGVGTSCKTP